jgi:hypothetical protein
MPEGRDYVQEPHPEVILLFILPGG